ncbi:MAG: Rid family hydrolase, partial [Candidatus Sericytochromatia bacterium]
LNGRIDQVYRVRWYLTDISRQEDVGRAHSEYFRAHPPVATMVEVKALVDPQMLVELELEAWAGEEEA